MPAKHAAGEIDRGKNQLGFHGVIINSHAQGEYLDDPKFWDIFEAAQALDTPVYLHPNTPPAAMIKPMLDAGLDGAIWGFAAETGTHLLPLTVAEKKQFFQGNAEKVFGLAFSSITVRFSQYREDLLTSH